MRNQLEGCTSYAMGRVGLGFQGVARFSGGGGCGTSERGLMERRRDTVSPFFDGSPSSEKIWDAYKRVVLALEWV